MNRQKPLLTLCLLIPIFAFSQQKSCFEEVDSFAATIKYKKSLSVLTKQLTDPYPGQLLKARAIFKWITENIQYDYKYYNRYYYKGKEPKTYKCKDDGNCEAKRIVWETNYINRVFKRKKAVCEGYSMLFKKMCDIAGLRSEIVTGYVRTDYNQVGTPGVLNHAWNAVWIDSAYYLLDATWAAGGCSKDDKGKLLPFRRGYDDYYWLTPASDFVRNHFPENSRWVLLTNYSKETFSANPYYAQGEISKIKLLMPGSGIINVRKGDTIHFKIGYTGYFHDLQINSNVFRNPDIWVWDESSKRKKVMRFDSLALKKQQYIKYDQSGDIYDFEYVVPGNSLYYLDILFDRRRVMRFKVNTSK